jgi:branched-chain amino acid transport system permease protein
MSSVTDRTLPLSAIATRRFGKLQWTAARAVLIGAVVFALLPLFAGEYWLNAVLIPFLAMSLAGIGLNLLMGYTGQASLGTGAFMAVGTYATYNFLLRVPELPLPISLVLGGLVAAGAGVIFGLPSLRIKGFLSAGDDAGGSVFPRMDVQPVWLVLELQHVKLDFRTAPRVSRPRPVRPVGRYYLTLATVVLLTIAAINIVRSQTGRNWMAIRDMDTAAAVIGIPVAANKLFAFAVSSFYCGIAGALWAFAYLGTVDARSFNLDRSFQVMFVIIIGGMGSIAGNFVGAAFILLLPILIDHLARSAFGNLIEARQLESLQKVLFGSLIIYLLIKEPAGLTALFGTLRRKLGFPPRRADEPAHSSNQ